MGVVATVAVPEDLVALDLWWVRLALRVPFVASHGVEEQREVVIIRARTAGGDVGWGECSTLSAPTYTTEWTAGAWSALTGELGPAVLASAGDEAEPDPTRPMAWCGLDTALRDLAWRRGGAGPVSRRAEVPATAVLGRAATIDALLGDVDRAVGEGYRSVKCKIGPGWDVEPLVAVRRAFPDIALAADANGSFVPGDRSRLAVLDELGLAYLEQPLPAASLHDLAHWRRGGGTPVAVDESLVSLTDLDAIVRSGAADVVNVKPARVGGWFPAVLFAGRAADAGLGVFVGGMLETGVGRSLALRVAAHPACRLPTDVGPSHRYFAEDLTDPIDWSDVPGSVRLPVGPGLVLAPHLDRLERAAIRRHTVHR